MKRLKITAYSRPLSMIAAGDRVMHYPSLSRANNSCRKLSRAAVERDAYRFRLRKRD